MHRLTRLTDSARRTAAHRGSRRSCGTATEHRSGALLVETALCLPIFFMTIFFFVEMWRMVQFQQIVDQAALEGARAGIVPGATSAQAIAAARKLLNPVGATAATVTVTPSTITTSTTNVSVQVTVRYGDVGLFYRYVPSTYSIRSTCALDSENQRFSIR